MTLADKFKAKLSRYGSSLTAYFDSGDVRCPGFNELYGYCDPKYHRDHPEAPQCNDGGFISGKKTVVPFKAFVLPVTKEQEEKLATLGTIKSDDKVMYYAGDVRLEACSHIEYQGQRYSVQNADEYVVSDLVLAQVALLRVMTDV